MPKTSRSASRKNGRVWRPQSRRVPSMSRRTSRMADAGSGGAVEPSAVELPLDHAAGQLDDAMGAGMQESEARPALLGVARPAADDEDLDPPARRCGEEG